MQNNPSKLLTHAEKEIDRRLRERGLRADTWRDHPVHDDLVDSLTYECDFEGAVEDAVAAIESAAALRLATTDRPRPRARSSEDPSFIPPPEDWQTRSYEVLDKFEAQAEKIRVALTGGTAHLAPAAACELLTRLEGTQEGIGDSLTLPLLEWFDYGDGSGRFVTIGLFQAFRGYHPDFDDEDCMSSPVTPAFSLARWADVMVRYTGCRLEEAIGFILAGVTFTLPWVQITRTPMRGTNTFGLVRYEIVVGSPDVPGEDIRKAYIAFRKNYDPESANRRPRRRTRGGDTDGKT